MDTISSPDGVRFGPTPDNDTLTQLKRVSPWDFCQDNAGWSNHVANSSTSGEDIELCIEANLVDPSIVKRTKTSYLHRYRRFLVPLLKPDRNDHPGWPPDFYPYNGPFKDRASDNCHTGVHDKYQTTCEHKYNEEYKVFWADIRYRYGQLFRTQVQLDMREESQREKMAALQRKSVCSVDNVNMTIDDENESESATLRRNYCFSTARTPSVKDSKTRHMRYSHIDRRYPRDTNGLSICEQEI